MYQSTPLLVQHIYFTVTPSTSTQFSSQIFSIPPGQVLLPQGKNLPPCFTERADQYTVQGINVMVSRWRAWEATAALEILTRSFRIMLFID
jgi:hypothetical protein